jgi:leucyl-tRNA synthetase
MLQQWPTHDKDVMKKESVVIVVQVNGKVRSRVTVPAGCNDEELKRAVLDDPKVQAHTDSKKIKNIIIVPNKLVSIVAK